jgi:serine phosphatase RsbU (regulator of sigma subunit)
VRNHTGDGRGWLFAALAIVTVVAVTDLLVGDHTVVISLVIVGPLVASMTVPVRSTAIVGLYAVAWSVVNGMAHDMLDTKDYLIRLVVIVSAGLLSLYAAREREQRESALREIAHVAEVAQRAILRRPPRRVGRLACAARYTSASEAALIGGDFYETAFTLDGVRVVVGDVRGKGLDAVRLAATVLGAFRESVFAEGGLAALAGAVNASVTTEVGEEDFVTAAFVEAPASHELLIVNCGHHPPLWIGPSDQALLTPSRVSRPLGLDPDVTIDRFPLGVGDRVLLYTDGLVEARNPAGVFFPFTSHADVLRGADLDACLGELLTLLFAHVGGRVEDDLALMLVERLPD